MAETMEAAWMNDAFTEDKLIEHWQEYPCLYDVRSADFKNRDKRQQALENIATQLNQSVDWVKNKLRQLRNSYTKARKNPPSGSARKNCTKRTALLLEKMQLLSTFVAVRPSVSNLEFVHSPPKSVPTSTEDEEDEVDIETSFSEEPPSSNTQVSISQPPSAFNNTKKSLKRRREEEEYELMKGLADSIAKKSSATPKQLDEIDTFGAYIVASMRKLDARTRLMIEHQITNLLFQAQMGYPNYQQFPQQPHYQQQSVPQQAPPQQYPHQQLFHSLTPNYHNISQEEES